jgi:gliding motility-associated-like protein
MRTIYLCLILQLFFLSVTKSQRIISSRTICLGDTIRISPADFRCQDTQATVSWKLVQFLNLLTRNNKDKGVTFQGNQTTGVFDALLKCNNETLAIRITVKDCDTDIKCLGQNLVPNPSADIQETCKPNRNSLKGLVADWEGFPIDLFLKTDPGNYFNTDCPYAENFQQQKIFESTNSSRNGNAMFGMSTGESGNKSLIGNYIGVALRKTLTVGRRYRIRFFIKKPFKYAGNNVDRIGAAFTIGYPDSAFNKKYLGPISIYDITYVGDSAKVRHPAKQFIREDFFWTKVEGTFYADKPSTHLLIGDFGGISNEFKNVPPRSPLEYSYYLLDDFSVQEIVNVFEAATADTIVCKDNPAQLQFKYPLQSVSLKNLTTNESKQVDTLTTIQVLRVSQTVCFEVSSLLCNDTFKVCFRPTPPLDSLLIRTSCNPQDTGIVIKKLGCDSVVTIKTELRTPLKIELITDTIVDEGSRFLLNPIVASGDSIKSISWQPPLNLSCSNCLFPQVTALRNSSYELTVVSQSNCISKAQQQITVRQSSFIYVPNAFSPNGDGQNDRLIVFANPNRVKQIRRFALFNRWGNLVFEKFNFPPNDESSSWDGIINGKSVSNDVFTYFVEVVLFDDQIKLMAGDVNLVD